MKYKEINIKFIPNKQHRYDTSGDYWLDKNGVWQFRISEELGFIGCMLVLFHELAEWFLTQLAGIKEEDITKFDTKTVFKIDPKNGDDPGNSLHAPYHWQHLFGNRLERIIAQQVKKYAKFDFGKYNKSFDKLIWRK